MVFSVFFMVILLYVKIFGHKKTPRCPAGHRGERNSSVVPPEFGYFHTQKPVTGPPAGISSRGSGQPRPSSPVTGKE
jgi:hypothetical protein